METIYNNDGLYKKFFDLIEKQDIFSKSNGQLNKFCQWLYENDFLKSLDSFYYENINDDDFGNCFDFPTLYAHKIAIGIDIWDSFIRIGIDDIKFFNKTSSCSILASFPLSKREERRLYVLLDKLVKNKTEQSRDWHKNCGTYWYGKYRTFG